MSGGVKKIGTVQRMKVIWICLRVIRRRGLISLVNSTLNLPTVNRASMSQETTRRIVPQIENVNAEVHIRAGREIRRKPAAGFCNTGKFPVPQYPISTSIAPVAPRNLIRLKYRVSCKLSGSLSSS